MIIVQHVHSVRTVLQFFLQKFLKMKKGIAISQIIAYSIFEQRCSKVIWSIFLFLRGEMRKGSINNE